MNQKLLDLLNLNSRLYGTDISKWPSYMQDTVKQAAQESYKSLSPEEYLGLPNNVLQGIGAYSGPLNYESLLNFASQSWTSGQSAPPTVPTNPTPQENLTGRPTNVPSPSTLNATGARGMDLNQFEAMLRLELNQSLPGFQMQATKMQDQFLRVAIRGPNEKDAIHLDLRPGPLTTFGKGGVPSIEMVSPSGWSRVLGGEVYLPESGSPQLRDPLKNFTEYIKASRSPVMEYLAGQRASATQRFSTVLARGWEEPNLGVAGGLMQVGPVHPEAARTDIARRLTVQFGEGVTDINAALRSLQRTIYDPQSSADWQSLRGMVVWKGNEDVYRLREAGTVGAEGQVWGMGKSAADILKRIQIGPSVRETTEFVRLGPGGRTVENMPPEFIQPGNQGGYQWLNALIPGETERRAAIVRPGTFFTAGTPFSGSNILYQDVMSGAGGPYSARYPSNERFEFPQLTVSELSRANIQWGRFEAVRDKEGQVTGYQELKTKEGASYPLVGQYIQGGTSAIVGMVKYQTQEGVAMQEPIRINAEGRSVSIRGAPQWYLPPEYSPGTGKMFSGNYFPDEKLPGDIRPSSGLLPQLQAAVGQGNISFLGRNQIEMYLPTGIETGYSEKGGSVKDIPFYPSQTSNAPYMPRVNVGQASTIIQGMTGELKTPGQFAWTFGGWSRPTQHMALGEFGGAMGKQLQAYARSVGTAEEGALDPTVMAKMYYGEKYQAGISEYGFYDALRAKIRALPQDVSMQRYGEAVINEPQKMPVGVVTQGERSLYTREFFRAYQMANEGLPISGQEMRRSFRQYMSFEPTGREGLSTWSVNVPGVVSTKVAPATSEFLARNPLFGYEEMAAINMLSPSMAQRLGLDLDQNPEATGLYPRHARAWREVGDIARYMADERLGGTPPPTHTQLTGDRAMEVMTLLNTGKYTLEELDKLVGGKGPLYNPATGQLLERPGTVADISTYRFEDTELQEPISRFGRQYPEALRQFIMGGDSPAIQALINERNQVFGAAGRGVPKLLGGRFSAAALGGRYAGVTGVGVNVAVLTQERMNQAFRQMAQASNVKFDASFQRTLRQQMKEIGYIPGTYMRSPLVSRTSGAVPIYFTTPEALKAKTGIVLPEASRFERGRGIQGRAGATGLVAALGPRALDIIGDWDADYISMILDAKLGQEGIGLEPGTEYKGEQMAELRQQFRAMESRMGAGFGTKEGVPGGIFDVIAKSFQDMFPGMRAGEPAQLPGMAEATLTGQEPSELFQTSMTRLQSRGGMGVAYNLRRLMEASSAALGFGDEAIATGGAGMGLNYQTYLDYITSVMEEQGGYRNLETFMQSGIFTAPRGSSQVQLMFKGSATGRHQTYWQGQWGKGMDDPLAARTFTSLLGRSLAYSVEQDIEANKKTGNIPSMEAAAYMFATQSEDIPALRQAMEEKGITPALFGEGGYYQDPNRLITQSPVGLSAVTSALGRTRGWLGKLPRQVEIEGGGTMPIAQKLAGERIPLFGQSMSFGQLSTFAPVRAASNIYQFLTRRTGWTTSGFKQRRSPLPPTEGAFMQGYGEQLQARTGNLPMAFRAIASQVGTAQDVEAVRQAGNLISANVSLGEGVGQFIPSRIKMRGSELGWFLPGGPQIYSPETEAALTEENRAKFIMREGLGLGSEELNRIFPMTPEQKARIEEGNAFEKAMVEPITQALGIRGAVYGLNQATQQGQIDMRRVFGEAFEEQVPGLAGKDVSFGMTPDIWGLSGPEESEVLSLVETKHARSPGEAMSKAYSPGYRLQTGSYALGLRFAAMVNASAVEGPFGKLVLPGLQNMPFFQAMGGTGTGLSEQQRSYITRARQAARRGIDARLAVGWGEQGNYQIYSPQGATPNTGVPLSMIEQLNMLDPFFGSFRAAGEIFRPENYASNLAQTMNSYVARGGNLGELIEQWRSAQPPTATPAGPRTTTQLIPPAPPPTPPAGGTPPGGQPPVPPAGTPFAEPEGPEDPNQRAWRLYNAATYQGQGGGSTPGEILVRHLYQGGARTPQAAALRVRGAIASGFAMAGLASTYEEEMRAGLTGIIGEEGAQGLELYQMYNRAREIDPSGTRSLLMGKRSITRNLERTYKDLVGAYGMLNQVLPGDISESERQYLGRIVNDAYGLPEAGPQSGFRAATTMAQIQKDTGALSQGYKVGLAGDELDAFKKKLLENVAALEHHTKVVTDTSGAYSDAEKQKSEIALKTFPLETQLQQQRARYQAAMETLTTQAYDPGSEEYNKALVEAESAAKSMAVASGQLQSLGGERQRGGRFWGTQASRFTRGLIGGWGLFYLQHLAQLPVQALSYGYPESQAWETQQRQYAGQYLGEGVTPFAADQYEMLRSQVAQGGGFMSSLNRAGAGIPPLLRTMGGIGLAGMAGAAATMYVGSTASMAGAGALGAAIAPLALPIGLITAGLAGIGIASSWRQNVPTTQLGILSQSMRTDDRFTFDPGRFLTPGYQLPATLPTPGAFFNMMGAGAQLAALTPEQRLQTMEMDIAQRQWFLGVTPQTPAGQLPTLLSAIATSDQFKGLDPQLVYQTLVRQQAAGQADYIGAKYLTQAQMRGIPTLDLATQAMQAFRQRPTAQQGYGWEMQFAGLQNVYQTAEAAAGLQTIAQVPLGYAQQVLGGGPQEMITRAADLARSPELGLFQQQAGLYQQMYAGGREGYLNLQRPVPGMTREQRYRFTQELLKAQSADQRAQAGQALGLPAGMTEQLYGMVMSGPVGQANADRILQTYTAETAAGYTAPNVMAAMDQQNAQLRQMAVGVRERLTGILGTAGAAQAMVPLQPFMEQNYYQANFAQRMAQFEPIAWTQAAMAGGGQWMSQNMANVDINLRGDITGLPWGTTSLQRGGIAGADIATQIWGNRWQGTPWGEAAVNGIATPSGRTVAGTRGLQWQQYYAQVEMQQGQLGIQAAQIALQEKYQPMFWALEDRQRALSDTQAQWGFQQQFAQLGMQNRQFFEQMGLQQRGTQMQRAWTREDWAMNEQQRAMQWGWRQEDFQEQLRFMTGRERRLAERGMERETITYGLETERIEKQQDRQKRLWSLEDERYQLNIQHHEEQRRFQEEAIAKQKEFYEIGKQIRDEQVELQREYWREQIELQKASLGIQGEYLKKTKEAQEAMMELQDAQEDYNGMWRVATTLEADAINAWIRGLNHVIEYLQDMPGLLESGNGIPLINPAAGTGNLQKNLPQAIHSGGIGLPGRVLVGEGGPEMMQLDRPASVYNAAQTYSMLFAGQMQNPWQNQTIAFHDNGRPNQNQPTTIIVNIGNERLGQFVLDTVDKALEVS